MSTKKVLVLAGDCIGPEVMVQARRVLDWLNESSAASFEIEEGLVGGASYDVHGTPLTR
jgi:3-isopropylmalate dehydrogenase